MTRGPQNTFVECHERGSDLPRPKEAFRALIGDLYGFLVPGDRDQAAVEIRCLLEDWPGDLVELGGQRVPASTIDPGSVVIRYETEPRARDRAAIARYAIDGSFIDGRQGA